MIDHPVIAEQWLQVNNVIDATQQHSDGKRCKGMGQDHVAEAKASRSTLGPRNRQNRTARAALSVAGSSHMQQFPVKILLVPIRFWSPVRLHLKNIWVLPSPSPFRCHLLFFLKCRNPGCNDRYGHLLVEPISIKFLTTCRPPWVGNGRRIN